MPNPAEVPGRSDPVLFQTGLHPMSAGRELGLAGFLALVAALIIRHNDLPASTDAKITLVCLALAMATLAGPFRRLRRSAITVTPTQLRLELGTWRPRVTSIPLREIESVDVRSGTVGRRLDWGTVQLAAGDDTYIVVH